MIDIEVEKLAKNFINKYSLPQEIQNHYKLDLTLYSCNLIDYILNFEFLPGRVTDIEVEILEASAYLGISLHYTLIHTNSLIQADLSLSDLSTKEVKLSISQLKIGDSKPSVVKLSRLLRSIYLERKDRPRSLGKTIINSALSTRPMEQIALGLVLGYSSYYEGSLKDAKESDLLIHFHEVFKFLAINLENIIKLNNPLLEKVEILPLINPALIGPALGYQEESLGSRAITTLASKLSESKLDEATQEQFFRALLRMPDLHCSSLGYIFLANSPNRLGSLKELGEFAMNYPILCSKLRAMYQFLRKKSGGSSWETLASKKKFHDAWAELDAEHSCGLLPFIYAIKIEDILIPEHLAFYQMLSIGKIQEAMDISAVLPEENKTASLLLNLALNSLLLNDTEKSGELIKAVFPKIEEKQTALELENCLNYILHSLLSNRKKIEEHNFSPVRLPTLWNLNYIYTKVFLEDRIKYQLPLNIEILPTIEEEGLSSMSEYYSLLLFSKTKRNQAFKLSSTPFNYWLEAVKIAKKAK